MSKNEQILIDFMKHLRDQNTKPGVLAEHEMIEIVKEYLSKTKKADSTHL